MCVAKRVFYAENNIRGRAKIQFVADRGTNDASEHGARVLERIRDFLYDFA